MDVFLFLNCVPAGPTRVVLYFPALDCNSEAYYTRVRLVYVVLALWVLSMPILMLYFLVRLHRQSRLSDGATIARWGALYRSFTDRFYWYEILLLVRRIVVVSISVLWISEPALRSGSLNTLFLALILFHIRYRPYASDAANAWETVSLVSLALLSTLVSNHSIVHDGAYPLFVQIVSSLVVVLVGGLLFGAAAYGKISQVNCCRPIVKLVDRVGTVFDCFGKGSSDDTMDLELAAKDELAHDSDALELPGGHEAHWHSAVGTSYRELGD